MKQDAIIQFFQHIASRESSYGIQNAFRFKAVLVSRKRGIDGECEFLKSRYGDDGGDNETVPAPVRRKKTKNRETSGVDASNMDNTPVFPSTDDTPAPWEAETFDSPDDPLVNQETDIDDTPAEASTGGEVQAPKPRMTSRIRKKGLENTPAIATVCPESRTPVPPENQLSEETPAYQETDDTPPPNPRRSARNRLPVRTETPATEEPAPRRSSRKLTGKGK